MRGGRKEWGKRNADRGSSQCKNLACSRSRKRSQRGWHPVVEGKEVGHGVEVLSRTQSFM